MPGPNIVGITVCVGSKLRGAIGAITSVAGFVLIPWTVGLTLGSLYLQYAHIPLLQNILRGLSAAAAGLLIATRIGLLLPHRARRAALLCRARLHRDGISQGATAARPARPGAAQRCRRGHRRRESTMSSPSASVELAAHLAMLLSISFGGFPSVLPDVHNFVVANGWVTDREFANFFAVSQVVPGPNMILMMSFAGLKVGGIPGAIASAVATFGPPCAMYFTAYRLWDRFRNAPWQRIVRRGLAPLTIGLVIAGGYVMARAGDVGWQSAAITVAAVALMLGTRINPLWILMTGGALGGLGFL